MISHITIEVVLWAMLCLGLAFFFNRPLNEKLESLESVVLEQDEELRNRQSLLFEGVVPMETIQGLEEELRRKVNDRARSYDATSRLRQELLDLEAVVYREGVSNDQFDISSRAHEIDFSSPFLPTLDALEELESESQFHLRTQQVRVFRGEGGVTRWELCLTAQDSLRDTSPSKGDENMEN